MKRIPFASATTPVALAAFLLLVGVPAGVAGQARARGAAPAQGQAVQRGQGQGQRESRREARPQAAPPRAAEPPRSVPPRVSPPPRVLQPPLSTAVPRTAPRVIRPNNDHPIYRPDYRPNYRPAYRPSYRPSYGRIYRPAYPAYYRPYYTFRPRLQVRFGLWVGYPVAYPYYMYPAVSYPAPYPYTYPPPAVYAVPGATPGAIGVAGGLSFDITPPDARIYVDNQYMGVASQFLPTEPPLSLAPGRHHVEVHASGFEVIAFDVDIAPGEVIPYQGDLRPF